MTFPAKRSFWDLTEAEMDALAGAADTAVPIPRQYQAGVAENLKVLLGHARILVAALPEDGRAAPAEPFEP